jgi:hypothetical protein
MRDGLHILLCVRREGQDIQNCYSREPLRDMTSSDADGRNNGFINGILYCTNVNIDPMEHYNAGAR